MMENLNRQNIVEDYFFVWVFSSFVEKINNGAFG